MKHYVFFISGLLSICWLIESGVAYNKPSWQTSQWWDLDSSIQLVFKGDVPGELMLHEDNVRYYVSGTGARTIEHGSGSSFNVYILMFSGLVYGEGYFEIESPFPIDLPVVIPDTTISGEVWVDTETLNIVRWQWSLNEVLLGEVGSSYEPVGEVSIDWSIEYDGQTRMYDFPLNLGDQWSDSHTTFLFGDYEIIIDSFGLPQEDSREFDVSSGYNWTVNAVEISEINDLSAVKIQYSQQSSVQQEVYYSWDAEWNAGMWIEGMQYPGAFLMEEWEWDLNEFGFSAATPQPTRTPVPPTSTRTPRPTSTPPPTPSGTQPTPTATFTLPPWIPPTRTPTPGPPTPTPPPPSDRVSIRIQTNREVYTTGDKLELTTTITNPLSAVFVMEYILLQYGTDYWFWPEWGIEVQGQFRILPAGSSFPDEKILDFVWSGITIPLNNVTFWAFLTEPSGFDIVGDYDQTSFHFVP